MGYKCGNCGFEGQNKGSIVKHSWDVHESAFLEGDERMVEMSKALINEHAKSGNEKAKSVLEQYEEV